MLVIDHDPRFEEFKDGRWVPREKSVSEPINPLSVACHFCGAPAGESCGTVQGGKSLNAPTRTHKIRISDAEKLATKGIIRSDRGWVSVVGGLPWNGKPDGNGK